MDTAVELVQAYLYVNGYFTVTEYPVVERSDEGDLRSATDLDVLALRYPGGGIAVPHAGRDRGKDFSLDGVDDALKVESDQVDMLVAEVKEGKARFNKAMFKPSVLRSALRRFGCCESDETGNVVDQLLKTGEVTTRHRHRIRQAVFGLKKDVTSESMRLRIGLDHVREYLENYIDKYWEVFRQANFSDPGLSWLITLKKTRVENEEEVSS